MWSSLQGRVEATYQELVAVFGEPNCHTDGYKTDAEWEFNITGRQTVNIYNYKNGKNYLGGNGLPVESITTWNIVPKITQAEEIPLVLKSNKLLLSFIKALNHKKLKIRFI